MFVLLLGLVVLATVPQAHAADLVVGAQAVLERSVSVEVGNGLPVTNKDKRIFRPKDKCEMQPSGRIKLIRPLEADKRFWMVQYFIKEEEKQKGNACPPIYFFKKDTEIPNLPVRWLGAE